MGRASLDNHRIMMRAWLLWNDREPDEKRWRVSYRLDTWQIWEQDDERRKLGLHIELDDDPEWGDEPYVIRLGAYRLSHHKYLHRAIAELCTRAGNTVGWAQWHLSGAGFPCHSECEC